MNILGRPFQMESMGKADRVALRQKFRDHWNTRDQIFNPAPETANKMGKAFFWSFACSLVWMALWVAIPAVESSHKFLLKCLVWFIFMELVLNWGLTAMKVLSRLTKERIQEAVKNLSIAVDWPVCPTCQLSRPPRSHHCPICNMCVMKRDHHCFFTASCIGFHNERYFVVLTFYITLGSAYGALLITWFFSTINAPHSVWSEVIRYVPVVNLVQWYSGELPTLHLLLMIQWVACVVVVVAAGGYFLWHASLVMRGQTTYERYNQIQRYQLGAVRQHLRMVFGPYWALNFVFPLKTLPDGDGIIWQTEKFTKGK